MRLPVVVVPTHDGVVADSNEARDKIRMYADGGIEMRRRRKAPGFALA